MQKDTLVKYSKNKQLTTLDIKWEIETFHGATVFALRVALIDMVLLFATPWFLSPIGLSLWQGTVS